MPSEPVSPMPNVMPNLVYDNKLNSNEKINKQILMFSHESLTNPVTPKNTKNALVSAQLNSETTEVNLKNLGLPLKFGNSP